MKQIADNHDVFPVFYKWDNVGDDLWLDLSYRGQSVAITLSEVEWRKLEKMLKRKRKQLDKKG